MGTQLFAVSGALQALAAIAAVLGSLGGAAVIAELARRAFTNRRQEQRRKDATWGYRDPDGNFHPGLMDDITDHIADTEIHLPRGGHRGTTEG